MKSIVVNLPRDATFDDWRCSARRLLQQNVQPAQVEWYSLREEADFFSSTDTDPEPPVINAPLKLKVSSEFINQCDLAFCHRAKDRFALMYRMLWRQLHEQPHLMNMAMDPDVIKLQAYQKAVRRDLHKMTAFVRFDTQVAAPACSADTLSADATTESQTDTDSHYIAWFESDHHILIKAGDFFMRRFTNTTWTIATPLGGIHWDQEKLHVDYTPILKKPDTSCDIEALWNTYYASIFNPARLKSSAMQSEMPKKYWRNLPETQQITSLTNDANARTRGMLAAKPSSPPRWAQNYRPHGQAAKSRKHS